MEASKPSKIIERNLMTRSASNEFSSAKEEWFIESIIDSTCDDFSVHCQLCNTANLKYNFVLFNQSTNQRLCVGSTCIIRFGVVKGIVDIDSGVRLLQNIADEQHLLCEVQNAISGMMVLQPDSLELSRFYKALKTLMDLKGIKNPTTEQLIQACYGNTPVTDAFKLARLRTLWDKPGAIDTIRRKPVKRDRDNPKEGTTWGSKKRTRVESSFSHSNYYNTEDYVVSRKQKEDDAGK